MRPFGFTDKFIADVFIDCDFVSEGFNLTYEPKFMSSHCIKCDFGAYKLNFTNKLGKNKYQRNILQGSFRKAAVSSYCYTIQFQ